MEQDLFVYDEHDFFFKIDDHTLNSRFDNELLSKWDSKMNEKTIFWYPLHISKQRIIDDKYLLQLNVDRAQFKRPPAPLNSINEPFNHERFNFNKMKSNEKIFLLKNKNDEVSSKNVIAVNVSPLEYGHVLLIPNPEKCYPQILTEETLKTAVEMCLLSGSRYFRVVFNSLGAFASVNHLHFHGYYLKHRMFLENSPTVKLLNECHQIVNYPAHGFVYQIRNIEELPVIICRIFALVQLMQDKNIPHNIYITRGLDFELSISKNNNDLQVNCLRIYVWARKPSWGSKDVSAFNIATCELFGHMVIKKEEDFSTLTKDSIVTTLENITTNAYETIIAELFKHNSHQ